MPGPSSVTDMNTALSGRSPTSHIGPIIAVREQTMSTLLAPWVFALSTRELTMSARVLTSVFTHVRVSSSSDRTTASTTSQTSSTATRFIT